MTEQTKSWWHSLYLEHLCGPFKSRQEALDAGIAEYGIEPFYVTSGNRFKYQAPHISIDFIADWFDDANAEYGPEDEGPSASWSDEDCRELEAELSATITAWLDRHKYRDAWAIDARGEERIDQDAIKARMAELQEQANA